MRSVKLLSHYTWLVLTWGFGEQPSTSDQVVVNWAGFAFNLSPRKLLQTVMPIMRKRNHGCFATTQLFTPGRQVRNVPFPPVAAFSTLTFRA